MGRDESAVLWHGYLIRDRPRYEPVNEFELTGRTFGILAAAFTSAVMLGVAALI